MRTEYHIARHLYYSNAEQMRKRPAVQVALIGIIIGLVVMLLTIAIVLGFKNAVTSKVTGFSGHIEVVSFDSNNTYEMQPIAVSDSMVMRLAAIETVSSANKFATKPGIIKSALQIEPIVLKGMPLSDESAWEFYKSNLKAGRLPQSKNEVIISKHLASKVNLKLDSTVYTYFVGSNIRVRKLQIVGIYQTDFTDYDQLFVLGDIAQVQSINGWKGNEVSGVELRLYRFADIYKASDEVYFSVANQADENGEFFCTRNVEQMLPAIFSWLQLLNMNVIVIIVLMLLVSSFSIVSGLIIMILENVQFVGVMKALGANNKFIRNVFLWQASFLVFRGMIIGNVIALLLCLVQYFLHIVPLDAATYYVSYVPVTFDAMWWLLINLGTFAVSLLVLLAPSVIITHISPSEVMRYE